MRVIAGKFKKSNLFSVPGKTTRPTTDYIKELIFSVIQDCEDKTILDLYAGSGGISIEAISRGAKFATMIDFSNKAIMTIKKNIEKLGISKQCRIYKKRSVNFLHKCEEKYDLIFLDPPYNKNLVNKTIEAIFENNALNPDGVIIVEHSSQEKISPLYIKKITYEKKNGDTTITILS